MQTHESASQAARQPRNELFALVADRVYDLWLERNLERLIAEVLAGHAKTLATQVARLAFMEPYIQKLRRTMVRHYEAMFAEVHGKLERWPKTERAQRAAFTKDGFDVDAYLFNTQKWHDTIAQDIRNHTTVPLVDGGNLANDQLGLGTSFDQTDPRVIEWLATNSKNAAFAITNTQYEALRATLMEAQTEGWNINKIRNALAAKLEMARRRAELIARTEVLKSSNRGSYLGYEMSGVVQGVQWEAAIDNRTCFRCSEMDGATMPLGKPFFKQGEEHIWENGTTDVFDYETITHPPLHPSCRCSISPITREI